MRNLYFNSLTVFVSVAVTLCALELGIRLYHGEIFNFSSQLPTVPNRVNNPRAEYHSRLGWVPRAGANNRNGMETVTPERLRSNGTDIQSTKRPILTVGDSFTFGDEVRDSETWPSQLQHLLDVPVVNGGVFAYGLDQAYLRALLLLEEYHPKWVILAFIMHDINRSMFSYYSAWKPYFEYDDGTLLLRNTPVPKLLQPQPEAAWLRTAISYSFLASALMRRYAEEWWYYGKIVQVHSDGIDVALDLVSRLQETVQANDAQLLVLALSTGGRIGNNEGMSSIVEEMRRRDVNVLDLVPEIEQKLANGEEQLFMPYGHYSPRLNSWVATRVTEYLQKHERARMSTRISRDSPPSQDTDE